jgi:hypothetical protein
MSLYHIGLIAEKINVTPNKLKMTAFLKTYFKYNFVKKKKIWNKKGL